MFADAVDCAADGLIADAGGPAWDAAGFAALAEEVRAGLYAATWEVITQTDEILRRSHAIEARLDSASSPALTPAADDIRGQLRGLVYRGFLTESGTGRLRAIARYLRAIEHRLDKLSDNAGRDTQLMAMIHAIEDDYRDTLDTLPRAARASEPARTIRWQIEELRVSLFAQAIGTAGPVSERRIRAAIEHLN
jgi:ATP-dependent helicase HrpA